MSSGGRSTSGQRHGRHRHDSVNAAWTPAVRPSEAGHDPSHARPADPVPAQGRRPEPPGRPAPVEPAAPETVPEQRRAHRSARPADRACRRTVPPATAGTTAGAEVPGPVPRWRPGVAGPAATGRRGRGEDPLLAPWREQLSQAAEPQAPAPDGELPAPPPPALVVRAIVEPGAALREVADDDTRPLALVPTPRDEDGYLASLETPPSGLLKFDLGTVPASVTPPRTWRKAAWFAVGTSAAVVCGLAVAAVRFVGSPADQGGLDALPWSPTRQLEIEQLPAERSDPTSAAASRPTSSRAAAAARDDTATPGRDTSGQATATTGGRDTGTPGSPAGPAADGGPESQAQDVTGQGAAPATTRPVRTTVGAGAITAADPQAMGDRTEQYFALVTTDPEAAHRLCAGSLAGEGPAGIVARYAGVERVEVRHIAIDRGRSATTSTVAIVRADGTSTVEQRTLTFTRGGDTRISGDSATT